MARYLYFYNPAWLAVTLARRNRSKLGIKPAGMQVVGMLGLTQNVRRTFGWGLRMMFGKIERRARPPSSAVPMRDAGGAVDAGHAPVKLVVRARGGGVAAQSVTQ